MGQEVTNQPGTETQSTQSVVEENINQGQTQEVAQEEQQPIGENSNSEVNDSEQVSGDNPPQEQQQGGEENKEPSIDELKAKIQQYELREEEDR